MSARLKPSSESISSWLRMRSAPPLAVWMNWPSSTMVAQWAAIASAAAVVLTGVDAAVVRLGRELFGFERDAPLGGERVLVDLVLCCAIAGALVVIASACELQKRSQFLDARRHSASKTA